MVKPFQSRSTPVRGADIRIGDEEVEAVVEVLRSGALREGRRCAEFEARFAECVGAGGACTVSSGTSALHAAYLQTVGEGDEVLVPAVSFFATASMVRWAGAVPVFCDIDPETYCIDVEDARRRIGPKTRAIAPVHLFGNAAAVDDVLSLAREHDLSVVWDAAQAHLTRWQGADVGALPGFSCYSFYATKNMTTGEGGMVTSNDAAALEGVRLLKRQGQAEKYRHTILGTNYRMTDLQAALGLVQLKRLPELTERRRRNAERFDGLLVDLPAVTAPRVDPRVEHSYHQYTITLDLERIGRGRDEIASELMALNVQVGINYPTPLHVQPVFAESGSVPSLPRAEAFCARCLSLPVQPYLEAEEIDYTVAALRHVLETKAS